ncbi:hypothetical protein GPU96_09g16780 [Encephalitozoon hellem]|uniref:Uncharacterized protein n=1 Tax=Encephalitozoon hellem TaxID=27973 RepID=A0A9Q9F8Q3_ENCHE|nr:hypothetical protein GPU96_01g00080 [Encephalitozoon hellem]UTX42683.1 hypothetical protein GPU96_02g03990 [Encephalitozoon hellem]UTX42694.1 hypothetical protein GPU96_03g04140 [Encephalitozoon hellem]UTX42869.1 hypothetical protein GPU96_03g05930 [Encephalitozoon hellem]UTX43072.1 hypothetical protein GPU96_04g08070 [Encephalitozoon hellem]
MEARVTDRVKRSVEGVRELLSDEIHLGDSPQKCVEEPFKVWVEESLGVDSLRNLREEILALLNSEEGRQQAPEYNKPFNDVIEMVDDSKGL